MSSNDDSDKNEDTTEDSTITNPKDSTTINPIDPTLNPRSLYYLHPDKNLGSILVAPTLYDDNYNNWRKYMCRALSSKNKITFINGNLPKMDFSNSNFELWDRANNMVLSWINQTISPHIAQSPICFYSAFDLCEDLYERYKSSSQYFIELKIIWDKLEDLHPTPFCSCLISCTCNFMKANHICKHMEHVSCFLKGLNDNYHNIRSQIFLLDPLHVISRLYSIIVQQ